MRHILIISAALCAASIVACDDEPSTPPMMNTSGEAAGAQAGETAGDVAGEMAGEVAGEAAGEQAGEQAGEVAGEQAGEAAGEQAGELAGEMAGEMGDAFANVSCDDFDPEVCVEIPSGDTLALQEAANSVLDDSVIVMGSGVFSLDNAVTLRGANNLTLIGQGKDVTTLDFSGVSVQTNGVDIISDGIRVEGFTIIDSPKDGLRIEDSDGVTIRSIKVSWSVGPTPESGAYGIYPVKVSRVLLEDSEAYNASDAGIYVGQCVHAIVRRNIAKANVAGIEIENTQFADVYDNLAEDNSAGLLVFDLPGNPVLGRDVDIHDNQIINNNRANFAPGGVVQSVPSGVGTFALASRRVAIHDNVYTDNGTFDVAFVNGLAIEGDEEKWKLDPAELVGDNEGLNVLEREGFIYNYASSDLWVYGNEHSGSGQMPDPGNLETRPLSLLLKLTYGDTPIDAILYDTIGESAFSATDAMGNSNDAHMCVQAEGATFASLDLETLAARFDVFDIPTPDDLYRPEAPFAPFDCEGFTGGAIIGPMMGVGDQ